MQEYEDKSQDHRGAVAADALAPPVFGHRLFIPLRRHCSDPHAERRFRTESFIILCNRDNGLCVRDTNI